MKKILFFISIVGVTFFRLQAMLKIVNTAPEKEAVKKALNHVFPNHTITTSEGSCNFSIKDNKKDELNIMLYENATLFDKTGEILHIERSIISNSFLLFLDTSAAKKIFSETYQEALTFLSARELFYYGSTRDDLNKLCEKLLITTYQQPFLALGALMIIPATHGFSPASIRKTLLCTGAAYVGAQSYYSWSQRVRAFQADTLASNLTPCQSILILKGLCRARYNNRSILANIAHWCSEVSWAKLSPNPSLMDRINNLIQYTVKKEKTKESL